MAARKNPTPANAPQHTPLSRESILEAALQIVDEEGLQSLSMRSVAARLGVTPMALYFHVKNKAELLDALMARVISEIQLPDDPQADWEATLLAFARSGRQVMRAHPGIAAAIVSESPTGISEPSLLLGERNYAAMAQGGFQEKDIAVGFYTVMVFTLGFVALETPRHPTPVAAGERDALVERLEAFFASLPATQYPQHVLLAPHLARMTAEDQFEGGLQAIIDGMRTRLDPTP